MAKHTDVGIFPEFIVYSSSDWEENGITGCKNDSTSSYATSKDVTFANGKAIAFNWTPTTVQSVIPLGATINSIKFRIVVRLSGTGTGRFNSMNYAYHDDGQASTTANYTYEQEPDITFTDSFSTYDVALNTVSNSLITEGLSVRIFLGNQRFAIRRIHLATVKILVTYTVPDITYTYKNYDGTVLKTQMVEQGTSPTAPSNPTRPDTAEYTYTFSGWSLSGTVYTAQYTATKRKYTVRWFNEDGTLLETDTTEYGVLPTYDGATPTKTATAEFTYTFKGWHIEVETVKGAIDYYARYTATTNEYTVLWKNYDGTVLETDTTAYGVLPTYDGATPARPSTVQHSYAFLGWDATIEEVTRDVVYTAVFSESVNEYTVSVSVNPAEGGSVSGGGTFDYGTKVTLTATPNSGYMFVRWNDGVTSSNRSVTVEGNASYIAYFEKVQLSKIWYGSKTASAVFDTNKNKAESVWYGNTQIL